jgi:type III secretory pathway component EscR
MRVSAECEENKRERGAAKGNSPTAIAVTLLPLQQLQVQQESWELSLNEVILLLHVFVMYPLSISNNMELSRGRRRFAEPR